MTAGVPPEPEQCQTLEHEAASSIISYLNAITRAAQSSVSSPEVRERLQTLPCGPRWRKVPGSRTGAARSHEEPRGAAAFEYPPFPSVSGELMLQLAPLWNGSPGKITSAESPKNQQPLFSFDSGLHTVDMVVQQFGVFTRVDYHPFCLEQFVIISFFWLQIVRR